jgi:hypothetical protein
MLESQQPKTKEEWHDCVYMPHALQGFHLRNHVWRKLLVRHIKPVSWPKAKIQDLLIEDEAREQLRKILAPAEKPTWQSFDDPTAEEGLARIILSFQGPAKKAATKAASRMTKRPLYRIRLLNKTEELEQTFRKAKALNAKWGCIFVIEDLVEACVAHTEEVARRKLLTVPLLWLIDNISGILVFLLSEDVAEGDPTQHIHPRIRRRICKHFTFRTQNADAKAREELWTESIRSRLRRGDSDAFPADDVRGKLKELGEFTLTWAAIRSTLHAVVPKGTAVSNIRWELILELARERAASE